MTQQAALPLGDTPSTPPTRAQRRAAFERKAAEAITPPLFRATTEPEEQAK